MKFTIKTIYLFAMILSFFVISNAQTNWIGEYFFDEDGGKTAGGSKIYIVHTITVTEENGKLDAHIYSQGFQTSRDIFADVKATDNKIKFYYREQGTDQFTGIYNKGDLLLSLEKKRKKGKTKLLTNWESFTPTIDANMKSGQVYFKKIKLLQKRTNSNLDWVRIESHTKDWSFAVPSNYFVNVEEDIYTIYFASKELSITINMDKKVLAKKRFREKSSFIPKKYLKYFQFFEIGKFIGSQFKIEAETSDSERRSISFASNKGSNDISINTANQNNPTFIDFLGTIQLKDKALFKTGDSKPNIVKIVNVTTLKPDKEIIEALRIEDSQQAEPIKITLDETSKDETLNSTESKSEFDRTIIILKKPVPDYSNYARRRNIEGQVRFRVEFLSDGKLGKIEIVSPLEKSLDIAAFDAVRKIKFLPATLNGIPINMAKSVVYNFDIF